jgi:ELWxxDGT repeat protein
MTVFNGALYFTGNDSAGFIGLWRSDGTAAGTVEVQRSTVAVGGNAYGSFFVSGTKMYFAAADASSVFNLNVMDTTGAINKLSPSSTRRMPASRRAISSRSTTVCCSPAWPRARPTISSPSFGSAMAPATAP